MKRDFNEFKEFIKGKNVAVVGIGVSNIPVSYTHLDVYKRQTYCSRAWNKNWN